VINCRSPVCKTTGALHLPLPSVQDLLIASTATHPLKCSLALSHPHLSEPICGRSDCRSRSCSGAIDGWLVFASTQPASARCCIHTHTKQAFGTARSLMKPACASLNLLIYLHAHTRVASSAHIHTSSVLYIYKHGRRAYEME
jgi:hypothetical protein